MNSLPATVAMPTGTRACYGLHSPGGELLGVAVFAAGPAPVRPGTSRPCRLPCARRLRSRWRRCSSTNNSGPWNGPSARQKVCSRRGRSITNSTRRSAATSPAVSSRSCWRSWKTASPPPPRASWPAVIADLDSLIETEVEQDGKRFLLRSPRAPQPASRSPPSASPCRRPCARSHPLINSRSYVVPRRRRRVDLRYLSAA